jgi:hypothetical protein
LEARVKDELRRHMDAQAGVVHACYIPGMPGMPDRIACVPVLVTQPMVGSKIGVFVGIECKRTRAFRTPIQRAVAKRIRRAGGIAIRVSSWAQVERLRRHIEKRITESLPAFLKD